MSDRVIPRRVYFAVFAALIALTAVTVLAAFKDMGPLNTIVAMTIACTKALLVVLYFMHVRWGTSLVRVVIAGALLWLVILLALTMSDYASRGWLGFPGK